MKQKWRSRKTCRAGEQALDRRGRYIAWGVVLILAGVTWTVAAVSLGYHDAVPVGGAILGVGIGILIRWCVRFKRNRDLRDAPPPPKWY